MRRMGEQRDGDRKKARKVTNRLTKTDCPFQSTPNYRCELTVTHHGAIPTRVAEQVLSPLHRGGEGPGGGLAGSPAPH